MNVRRVKLESCSECSWDGTLRFYGDSRAVGVCNEEATSPRCWLLMSKKVVKIIVCIIAPVSKSGEVYDPFPSSVFLLVLCKLSFSLGSSLCPRIILELKDTLRCVTLLPFPRHCFWGGLWLVHLMLLTKVAGGDVDGGGGGGFLVLDAVNCNLLWFNPTLGGWKNPASFRDTLKAETVRWPQCRQVFRAGASTISEGRRSCLPRAVGNHWHQAELCLCFHGCCNIFSWRSVQCTLCQKTKAIWSMS